MRSSIVCATLILASGQAWAELSVKALEQQPFGSDIAELFQLGQGQLLLRTRGTRERKPTPEDFYLEQWNTIYVLGADGQMKERVELPYGLYQFIVPYRDGFAAQQLVTTGCAPRCGFDNGGPAQIVAYERAGDTQPHIIYEPQQPYHTPRLYAAPDGQDLYVMEMGAQFQITRIDSSGQIAWQKRTAWLESSSFAATDEGAVFVQYASEQNPAMLLRAIDREGRPRWEAPIPSTRSYEAIYSAAGFITLSTYAASPQDRDKRRLLNFDARTGRQTADVLVEQFAYSVGTKDGLLVAGAMLGQPYVGMIDRHGRFTWLRRYVADQQVSDIQRATMTRANKLVLVTRARHITTTAPTTSVVVTDSTAASLVEARGGCLDPKWRQSVDLASQLRKRGLWVEPPQAEERTPKGPGCSDHETRFIAFMQALAAVAPAPAAQSSEVSETIAIRLTPAGEPLRLESYIADRSGYPSASVTLTFAAPYDQAAEFWKLLSTQVRPHLERMSALDDRFAQMTGFRYTTFDRSQASVGYILRELEKAARIVDDRIATIAPDQLAEIRSKGPHGWVQILLHLDGFGAGDNAMFPLAAADRTFLEIVRQNREAAARGEIVIRD